MYTEYQDLEELIAQAERGDIRGAREQLRHFTKRRPSTLLAWKWLADLAESPKERSAAIRRAQLLAPGDPWVIEAKKHRMPPKKTKQRSGSEELSASSNAMPPAGSSPLEKTASRNDPEEFVVSGEGVSATSGAYVSGEGAYKSRGLDTSGHIDPLVWVAIVLGVSGLVMISLALYLRAF